MAALNLSPNFFDHPKTRRLVELIGNGAEVLPMKLWAYAAKYHMENGKLPYSGDMIEKLCGWSGESGKCLQALLECGKQIGKAGFIEPTENGFQIHGWLEHEGHLIKCHIKAQNAARTRWDRITSNTTSNATSNACEFQSAGKERIGEVKKDSVPEGIPKGNPFTVDGVGVGDAYAPNPKVDAKMVVKFTKKALKTYQLNPDMPEVLSVFQLVRSNCAELIMMGVTEKQFDYVCDWISSSRKGFKPQKIQNMTDPSKWSQWIKGADETERNSNPCIS